MERHRMPENIAKLLGVERRSSIQRFAENVEQATETIRRHWHVQGSACIKDRHSPSQSARAVKCNSPDVAFVEVLVDLEGVPLAVESGTERLMERR
jgi:hypothetical protein